MPCSLPFTNVSALTSRTVIGERLQRAQPYPLFNQIAPRVVGIFLITPALDAVVFDLIELAGVEVQSIGGRVVAELFAIDELARVTAVQLAVGFVFVLDLATQFVDRADQFASRVVFVAAMNRVLAVFNQQAVVAGIVNLRELVSRHRRCKLPRFAAHRIVTEAAGEFALDADNLPGEVIALAVL